ncbi:MAG: hypothetical protein JWP38_1445 [Herbaspirillum sp.]|jgi:plastocyanin|nr:hypothetical protein [Herbaspirillum sp.]
MGFLGSMRGVAAVSGLFCAVASAAAWAETVNVAVTDSAGTAVPDAVVYAEAAGGQTLPKVMTPAEIAQKDQQFWPFVTVVQTGTSVTFQNRDKVQRQVYSFSPAKVFELTLYPGNAAAPTVVFDKAGTVLIGCNLYDQMIAYVHVVDTPYFAKTDAAGNARLENLPDGKYALKTWHYAMPAGVPAPEQPLIMQGKPANATVKLNTGIASD